VGGGEEGVSSDGLQPLWSLLPLRVVSLAPRMSFEARALALAAGWWL